MPHYINWFQSNLPQIISKVHNVTYLNRLKPSSLLTSCASLVTKMALCSWNTSIKSSNILKWNVGVKIWMENQNEKTSAFEFSVCLTLVFMYVRRNENESRSYKRSLWPLLSQMSIPFVENTIFCHAMSADQCQAKAASNHSLGFCQCVSGCSWLSMARKK